jgi:nucleoside-triphosphatase THEP1
VGKTSLIQKVIAWAKDHGIAVAGICSPAVFHHNKKTGIQIENITTGERKTLATVLGKVNSTVTTDAWSFEEKNLEWGNEILDGISKCQLLVIDELGILEIYQQRGWSHAIPALKNLEFGLAIVVVRPELCEDFKKTIGAMDVLQLLTDNHAMIYQQIISVINKYLMN